MDQQEIKRLAEKIISGSATEEELLLYNRLCNQYSNVEEGWDETLYGDQTDLDKELKNEIWSQTGFKRPVVRMKWFKWVAAASIIMIFSSLGFLLTQNSEEDHGASTPPSAKVQVQDINPGQNGAILTLATGEMIHLDSANDGSLVQQGNVSVVKKNGELVYSNKGKGSGEVYNTMTTPKGRQFSLVLSDGSKVWLNAASSITYPISFTGKERKVSVTGEAYFEIAHNAAIPFIVESGQNSVKVLGTHFNINAYDDESVVSVTLLEGSVDVRRGTVSKVIKPGQQAQINDDEQIKLTNNIDVEHVVAWKNGRISFQGADIGTVMRQMSRWYDVEIEYNRKMNDLFYADISRSTMLSDVLKALELTTDVHFKIEGRKVRVVP
jgi:hypothetical protein